MKIGIMSDTHNNLENTRWALNIFSRYVVDRIVHCGDITTPQIVEVFGGREAYFVFGNIDHNHADIMLSVKQFMGIGTAGYTYTGNWEGTRVAICHGHIAETLDKFINAGIYDYVFHGHTHLRRDERIGSTRVINPGALGGNRKQTRSVCVLNTDTDELAFIEKED